MWELDRGTAQVQLFDVDGDFLGKYAPGVNDTRGLIST